MADDPLFADNGKRNINRDVLTATLTEAFAKEDGQALADRLIRNGVPAGPVLWADEATAAPHTAHREMVTELDWYKGLGTPIKFSRTPGGLRTVPPKFSEHARQVLAEHGFDEAAMQRLAAAGVLVEKRRS